jgi:hypothetical protein
MHLQNKVMQLRKVCSHPFLFDWPIDPITKDPIIGEELVNASGKMMVLDRLLQELFRRDHKVLIFSQFTTMLDIIEVRFSHLFLAILVLTEAIRTGLSRPWVGLYVGLMASPVLRSVRKRWSGSKPEAKIPKHLAYSCSAHVQGG